MNFLEELECIGGSAAMQPYEILQEVEIQDPNADIELEAVSDVDSVDVRFSEAEKRIDKAMLYKSWLTSDLFEGDSEAIREVTIEFREFAEKKLKELLGMETPKQDVVIKSDFESEEVQALKFLVKKLMGKMDKAQAVQKTPQKTVQTVVKSQPEPAKPEPKALTKRPLLKPRKVPAEVSREPIKKSAEIPAPTVQPPKPQAAQQQTQQTRVIKPGTTTVKTPEAKKMPPVYPDGTIFEHEGRTYQSSWVPISPGQYGPNEERRINSLNPGATSILRNSVVVTKTAESDLFAIINKDITPKKPEVGAVAFPSPTKMTMVTASMAVKAAEKSARNAAKNQRGEDVSSSRETFGMPNPIPLSNL